jgi:hypothetical protein
MRMRGIFLNFLAQLVYHDAEILRLLGVIGSPDNLQQSLMSKRLSLLNDQRPQDVEFFWTQVDSVTVDIDGSLLEINPQFWSLDFWEGSSEADRRIAARMRANSSPTAKGFTT